MLVSTKKNWCSSTWKPVSLFVREHSKKKKAESSAKTSLLGNTIIQKWNISTFEYWCYPMTTFSRNFTLFFCLYCNSSYFGEKYFKKKRKVPRNRHLYFWLMVLPMTTFSGKLCPFFQNIFLQYMINNLDRHRTLEESVNFCSKQMRANTYFLLMYRQ